MANLVLPSKYADAIFLAAKEKNVLEQTMEDLIVVKKVLDNNAILKNIIFHPGISKDEKKKIFVGLFSGHVSELVVNFFKLLIDKKREKLIDDIINVFSEKVDEYNGIKKVTVETAFPLDEEEKGKLLKQLNEIMKSKVTLKAMTRQDMLGGVIIRDRLHLIDASINQFLNSMRNILFETRVSNYKKKIEKKKASPKKVTKKEVKKSRKSKKK
jgi:F-type H+-transporting ATPase subunit delta